jgi:eukaryotic-like serine/threonine-protein kinase
VQGVGPGTSLGGRYALRTRLSHRSDLEHWSAHDTTLERDVAVTVFDGGHPHAAAVLDAARRAAGVEDSRLVRILDVGTAGGVSWIIEESLASAESLATLLQQGPLPAEEARRIAGEAASALEKARQRGLHHLRLTPHAVLRTQDGTVKVTGTAIAAGIDGYEEPDDVAATRADTVALVALAYAALTGRWPLSAVVHGVEPAPRVVGGVAAPSEIAAGVPSDLDALCRLTLNDDAGPLTPGDFASQIAPWAASPVRAAATEPTVVLDPSGRSREAGRAGHGRGHQRDAGVTRAMPVVEGAPAVTAAAASASPVTPGAGTVAAAAAADRSGAARTQLLTSPGGDTGDTAASGSPGGSGGRGRVGSFARAAADKAADKAASARQQRTERERLRDLARQGTPLTLPEALWVRDEPVEPPAPLLPASTALAPTRDQSKFVLTVVAIFVVVALGIGACNVRNLGDGISLSADGAPGPTVTASAPAVTVTPTPTATPSPSATASNAPIAIDKASGFDPQGDDKERNSEAARVYDGDKGTSWTSEGYATPSFGGLKKGVGVLLDLGQPTQVTEAVLELGSKNLDVTVYAAPDGTLDGATEIGSKDGATGTVTLTGPKDLPKTDYVIVWFTSLAPDGGRFRASLDEITLG